MNLILYVDRHCVRVKEKKCYLDTINYELFNI